MLMEICFKWLHIHIFANYGWVLKDHNIIIQCSLFNELFDYVYQTSSDYQHRVVGADWNYTINREREILPIAPNEGFNTYIY